MNRRAVTSPGMQPIPRATVSRLPRYLRFLDDLPEGQDTVASEEISAGTGVKAAQVRKDLSRLGTLGTRGLGYPARTLRALIARALGLEAELTLAIVGAGNLGSALANYPGFARRGFRLVAIYDVEEHRIGTRLGGVEVRHVDELRRLAGSGAVAIGIVATPEGAAQEAVDLLVEAGVGSILSFAPTVVAAPPDVAIRQVDLATELQILSHHLARRPAL